MKYALLTGLFFAGFSLVFGSEITNASSIHDQGHFVIQAGGFVFTPEHSQQHINIEGLIGDDFISSKKTSSSALFGLGYLVDTQMEEESAFSYGINGFYLLSTSASGVVLQESRFANLTYSYSARYLPLYAVIKGRVPVSAPHRSSMQRYFITVDFGIGPDFIKTTGVTERDADLTIPDTSFSGHSTTALSGTIGVGLQVTEAMGHMPVECGYRFFFLGKGDFTPQSSRILTTLNTGSAYANALLCSLRF